MTSDGVRPGEALLELVAVMDRLRRECAWKREQTHRSLARYLLEETHETLDAIDSGDPDHLCEELGDLLLQVVFHAQIAAERDQFDVDDVARGIVDKLRRRNPHVFGDGGVGLDLADAAAVNERWQQVKAAEKPRASVLDGIPPTLPALALADKVLDRLTRAGLPVETAVEDANDVGDRLLAVVAEAREAGVDPEQALRDAVRRLIAAAAAGEPSEA